MPFDVPSYPVSPGGSLGPILGPLYQLGIGAAGSYIQSRFQTPTGGGTGDDGMGPEAPEEGGTLQVQVPGSVPSDACCDGKARLPDFLPYNMGPQCGYTRLTTRTSCGVTVRVWAPPRKKPRMNPYNMRAANRAARRLSSLGRGLKRQRKAVARAARELK